MKLQLIIWGLLMFIPPEGMENNQASFSQIKTYDSRQECEDARKDIEPKMKASYPTEYERYPLFCVPGVKEADKEA